MTPKELLEQKAREAVRDSYGCADFGRGKYEKPRPCGCYPDCKYGCGTHENYDLRDDCMADEFDNGFRAGWIAAMIDSLDAAHQRAALDVIDKEVIRGWLKERKGNGK